MWQRKYIAAYFYYKVTENIPAQLDLKDSHEENIQPTYKGLSLRNGFRY